MEFKKRSVGVHDGSFHADEVTACALLIHFNLVDPNSILRSRDPNILDECEYVCDVGGIYDPNRKKFDHHQASYLGELSSAGMVLKYLLDTKVIKPSLFDHLNVSLIAGVDAHDNGKVKSEAGVCTFSHIISNYMPIVYEASIEDLDKAFQEALDFVLAHLSRLIKRFVYMQSCKKEVEQAMQGSKEVLFFDRSIPWMDSFFELGGENHPARFVVMPSGKAWKLRGIPPTSHDRMQVREMLPKDWAGLLAEDLKKVSGIKGAIFCHKGRFISVWETKEDVLKALNYILKQDKK